MVLPERPSGLGTAVGSSLAMGTLGAALAAFLPATREGSFAGAWLGLAASLLIPMVAAVWLCRKARAGSVLFPVRSLGVFMLLAFLPWVVLGAVLRKWTHHHALSGVTYAVVASGVSVFALLVARRTSSLLRLPESYDRVLWGLMLLLPVLGTRGTAFHEVTLDWTVFLVAAWVGSLPRFEGERALGLAGPPIGIFVLVLGLWTLHATPGLGTRLCRTDAYGPIVQMVSGIAGLKD